MPLASNTTGGSGTAGLSDGARGINSEPNGAGNFGPGANRVSSSAGDAGAGASANHPAMNWAQGMLNQVMGGGAGEALTSLANLNALQLESLGLAKQVKGQNIFQRAKRTYRRFGDWRAKSDRVAAAN